MKTKPFNLEKALNGAKVVTRDGREVTQLTKFEARGCWELYGVVEGDVENWDNNGEARILEAHEGDLFLAVEPQRIWVNVFKGKYGNLYVGFATYDSKEIAIRCMDASDPESYIKTIEITDEL
jgi:hypothetical protein